MSELQDDLQATSDALLHDLERMRRLEEEKRALDPLDPRVAALSQEIEELSRRTQVTSTAEREIVEELQAQPANGDAG